MTDSYIGQLHGRVLVSLCVGLFLTLLPLLGLTRGQPLQPCRLPSCINGQPSLQVVGATTDCTCVCDKGFYGIHCDLPDLCAGPKNPCRHGGKCGMRPNGQYYCDCVLGYLAPDCQDRDPCLTKASHCLNGATCHRLDDIDFTCACPIPFEGDHCEDVNLCRLDPGECWDVGTEVDLYDPQCYPCSNFILEPPEGCIRKGQDDYVCNCLPGYQGDVCDEKRSEAEYYMSQITIPVMELHEMYPHNFIVHRIFMPKDAIVILAIQVPANFTIHIAMQNHYRPLCDDILEQWAVQLPVPGTTRDGDEFLRHHRVLSILEDDHDDHGLNFKRLSGNDVNDTESFMVLWPESSIRDSNKPTEVTFEIGVFQLDCITRKQLGSGGTVLRLSSTRTKVVDGPFYATSDPCLASHVNNRSQLIVCECHDVDLAVLREYLHPLEFLTETYDPVGIFQDVVRSTIIPWVVLCTTLLYLLLLLLFVWMDCRNARRPKLVVMTYVENIDVETFYLLTLQTGNSLFGATTSTITCEIYGSCAKAKPMILSGNDLQATRQDDEDNYLFSVPQNLGDLEKVRIWHDNTGPSPAWFLRKVIIKEIKSEKFWYFPYNCWLSVQKSSLICSAVAMTPEEMERHHRGTFCSVLRREWRERHLVLSPFFCPPHSKFSRSERVSLLFTVIFIYMILLIFSYGTPDHEDVLEMVEWGEFSIVWNNVWFYGLLVTLFGVPFSIIVAFLFRIGGSKKVPTLLVCGKKLDGIRRNLLPPPRPPLPDSIALARWLHLDPNRIMVVGVPNTRPRKSSYLTYYSPGLNEDDLNSNSESPSAYALDPNDPHGDSLTRASPNPPEFKIPSTSVSHTETWIATLMKDEKSGKEPVQSLAKPQKHPPYKDILNDGIMGAVVSMKDDAPEGLVYKPTDADNTNKNENEREMFLAREKPVGGKKEGPPPDKNIDFLIADDIKKSFQDPLWNWKRNEGEGGGGGTGPRGSLHDHDSKPTLRPDANPEERQIPFHRSKSASLESTPHLVITMVDASTQTTFMYEDAGSPRLMTSAPGGDPLKTKKGGEGKTRSGEGHGVELCACEYSPGRCTCPGFFRYVLFVLCILIMILAGTVTVIYGLRYGYTRSVNWCFSLLWAVIFTLFLIQVFIVLAFAVYVYWIRHRRQGQSYDEIQARERFQLIWFKKECHFPPRWPLLYIFFLQTSYTYPRSSFAMFKEDSNGNNSAESNEKIE